MVWMREAVKYRYGAGAWDKLQSSGARPGKTDPGLVRLYLETAAKTLKPI
jgi:hypothetical protein